MAGLNDHIAVRYPAPDATMVRVPRPANHAAAVTPRGITSRAMTSLIVVVVVGAERAGDAMVRE